MKRLTAPLLAVLAALFAHQAAAFEIDGTNGTKLEATELAGFDEPWAMTFLPDGRLLVTEKPGKLWLVSADGSSKQEVRGVPRVDYGGQGGFGDVILAPDFAQTRRLLISYVEGGNFGRRGAAVAEANLSADDARLERVRVIWRQEPKTTGRGHYSHRLAFGPDGFLYITSGDRQKLDPAQDMDSALGKIIRLNADGSVPAGNPWQDAGDLAKSFWSMGHRNMLGIAFDPQGRLWVHEMGPRNGDELNLVRPGANHGWPVVSEGNHYSGARIPNHDTRPDFEPPKASWVPTIAPSGLVIYDGGLFPGWQGDALVGGLASQALIHVDLEGETAGEAERFGWGERIREVEQGPDGALYVLEDGGEGRLLRLTPRG